MSGGGWDDGLVKSDVRGDWEVSRDALGPRPQCLISGPDYRSSPKRSTKILKKNIKV